MASIVNIQPVTPWSVRDFGSASKLNSQVSNKILAVYQNQVITNYDLGLLFQGVSGGPEQAKIPFVKSSAPTGWSRDTSFLTDHVLRVTDTSTVPPGASATATGGQHGGSWTITGIAASVDPGHTHTLADHTHTMGNHTHAMTSHSHGMNHVHNDTGHTHTTYYSLTSSMTGANSCLSFDRYSVDGSYYHVYTANCSSTHTLGDGVSLYTSHNHAFGTTASGNTSAPNVTETGTSSGTSGTPSNNTTGIPSQPNTGSSGSHSHSISHDGSWRPGYLNVLICRRD